MTFAWTNSKLWCIHTVNIIHQLKGMTQKETSTDYAITWINVVNIMESRSSQLQKITYCLIPFTWNGQHRKMYGDKKWTGDCLGVWGVLSWVSWKWMWGIQLRNETVLSWMMAVVAPLSKVTKNHWIAHPKWVNSIWTIYLK